MPTLVDRDLVLYDSRVIIEYLDERFPHPPMMPVDPVSRAHTRLALFRIETDWYSLLPDLERGDKNRRDKARTALRDSIAAAADVFAARPFFLSDEFTMVDALDRADPVAPAALEGRSCRSRPPRWRPMPSASSRATALRAA
ncbi:MAG: glutathione S-transferase N-terminal domain-containing protein [Halofilum sp. (in: g-proteobacteria)]|nr:glutathione S-transferase N-terminal domain-containing protein [Halofilum sp. (in: g-proteobacteria)]